MVKILGIIPARGGSKGLLRKNIRIVDGEPLVVHTIRSALGSRLLDKIVVSTDDETIKNIASEYAVTVISRPSELSQDSSSTIDVTLHVLDWLGSNGELFDIVVLLEPTSPLRKEDDIDRAIDEFLDNINWADAMVSLGDIHLEHPYHSKIIEGGYVKNLIPHEQVDQRQSLIRTFFPFGVIYLSKVETLRKQKTFYQERTIPFFIERWQYYEIDDFYDYVCVDMLKKRMSAKNMVYPRGLVGERVILREFTRKNLYDPCYFSWLQDKMVTEKIGRIEYLKPFHFCVLEDYYNWVKSDGKTLFFSLYAKKSDCFPERFIGTVKLGSINWVEKRCDVGIMIGDRNCWNQGLSKDAVRTVVSYAFTDLGMIKVTGGCLVSNIAMARCFEALGFKREAVLRKDVDGVDHILFGLFKEEFC